MMDIFDQVKILRERYPYINILTLFIIADTYKECNAIRSFFPEGIGDMFMREGMEIIIVYDGDSIENEAAICGRTAVRCLMKKGTTLSTRMSSALLLSFKAASIVLNVPVDDLIIYQDLENPKAKVPTQIDWTPLLQYSESTITCGCNAVFRSHCKSVSENNTLVTYTRKPCPYCGSYTNVQRASSDQEYQRI